LTSKDAFKKDVKFVNGLKSYTASVREKLKVSESKLVQVRASSDKNKQEVNFVNFPPGSVIAFRSVFNIFIFPCLVSPRVRVRVSYSACISR